MEGKKILLGYREWYLGLDLYNMIYGLNDRSEKGAVTYVINDNNVYLYLLVLEILE
jgi:hypothetical protein